MKKYIISYDLNGRVPTHAQMDERIRSMGAECGRLLETVWYLRSHLTLSQVYDFVNAILSPNDRVLVVEAKEAVFRNLLVDQQSLVTSWRQAA